MIHGIGTDIVAIARIEQLLADHGERAARKLLADAEWPDYRQTRRPAAFLAKSFAAKEALGKALGLGLRDPATLHNIAVQRRALGRPQFDFAPALADWMRERHLQAYLSLSDEADSAVAFVVVDVVRNPS